MAIAPKRSKAAIIIVVCIVVVILIIAIIAAAIAIPALKGNDSQVSIDPGLGENENDASYDNNSSYENDTSYENDASSDLPEFCGTYDKMGANATSYDNKYFGFKVNLDSSWSFIEDDEIEELTGFYSKSSLDLSNLKFGTVFEDMVASDYNGNSVISVTLAYFGNSSVDVFADYSGEDEILAEYMSGFYADYSSDKGQYIDYTTYVDKAKIGGLDAVSAVVEYYYDGEQEGFQKDYFAKKGDVIIVISTITYEYTDPDKLASMFSAS